MDDIDDLELNDDIEQRVEDEFLFANGNQDLDLRNDLIEQQEGDDDCIS